MEKLVTHGVHMNDLRDINGCVFILLYASHLWFGCIPNSIWTIVEIMFS